MVENDDLLLSTGVIETATYISNKEKHMQVSNGQIIIVTR